MKSFFFVTISLHNMAGGLEKNLVKIANYLSAKKYKVTIITFDLPDAKSFYEISENIEWIKVGVSTPHKRISFFDRLRLLGGMRHAFIKNRTEESTIIVFHHGLLLRTFLSSIFLNLPIVCSERNSLKLYDHVKKSKNNINFFLLRFCKSVIVQLNGYVSDYPNGVRKKIKVIPNAVYLASEGGAKPHSEKIVLAVGRLCAQKNFDMLIEAFIKASKKTDNWKLIIIGEGDFKNKLSQQITNLHADNKIQILPPVKNIEVYYDSADIFCMPSQWEGFPNALAEAISHGLPAIGYLSCAGVNELIQDNVNGLLAQKYSIESLEECLTLLMNDEALRSRLSIQSRISMHKFTPEVVLPLWENV